jgi:hypothetical protein
VDEAMRDFDEAEQTVKKMVKRLRTNVVAHFGEDSREYQKVGGKV